MVLHSNFNASEIIRFHQSLVGSVVIDIELGREDHGSIPRNCDREGLKPLDDRTNFEPG
jgi:hypothetical protein